MQKQAMSEFFVYATIPERAVVERLGTSRNNGLSHNEIQKRQHIFGSNILKKSTTTFVSLLKKHINTPFFYTFLFIIILYLFIGEWINAGIISIITCINLFLGVYQEYYASYKMAGLTHYLSSYVKCIRGGQRSILKSDELVPGDIIILEQGDKIPADCRFFETDNLSTDESALSGESQIMYKNTIPQKEHITELFEANTIGFAGTVVTSGSGKAIVFATGQATLFGNIAYLAQKKILKGSLFVATEKLAVFIVKLVLSIIALFIIAHLFIYKSNISFLDLLIFAASLAVSVIPETLPAVTTFCLSKGAVILAKHGLIIKRLSAIEDLGSMQVLCTDKTGTLTENDLAVAHVFPHNDRSTLFYAACTTTNMHTPPKKHVKGFDVAVERALTSDEKERLSGIIIRKIVPFDPALRENSAVIQENNDTFSIIRGAPEFILKKCALTEKEKKALEAWIQTEEQQGHRVLAIAKKLASSEDQPQTNAHAYTIVGLVSFKDSLKSTAAHAITQAKQLGLIIKLLSGDSPHICKSIAIQIGIIEPDEPVITGLDYEAMSSIQRAEAVEKYTVFARFSPEQKYEVVTYLQRLYSVGYIGDGINDGPALKIADVSLCVDTAVDISRDIAEIILLKKSLSAIITGIEEGRKIFINILKYIYITIASNFGNFFALIAALLFFKRVPILSTQLLILNLLTDFPMLALATDNVGKEEIQTVPTFNIKNLLYRTLLLGFISMFFDVALFIIFWHAPTVIFQTNWFIYSIVAEIFIIFSLRTRKVFFKATRPSFPLILLSGIISIITVLMPYSSFAQKSLHLYPPTTGQYSIVLFVLIAYFALNEIVKYSMSKMSTSAK